MNLDLIICILWYKEVKVFFFRIVRNKAAEKAKISGYGSCGSPELSPGSGGGQSVSLPRDLGLHEGHVTSLRHPSYSINGILGIHQQQDANANIQSRKREAEGKRFSTRSVCDTSERLKYMKKYQITTHPFIPFTPTINDVDIFMSFKAYF